MSAGSRVFKGKKKVVNENWFTNMEFLALDLFRKG